MGSTINHYNAPNRGIFNLLADMSGLCLVSGTALGYNQPVKNLA